MGIFSFGKKDEAPGRRGAKARSGRSNEGTRVERRSRRPDRSGDAEAMLLDPTLPEKQRARRRLVGAIALVLAAIVVLPMVLDSHPKPVTDDIAIDIPSHPAADNQADAEDTQAGVAPDNPTAADVAPGASGLVSASAATATAAAMAKPPAAAQPAPQAATPAAPTAQTARAASSSTAAKSAAGAQSAQNTPAEAAPAAKPQAAAKPATKPDAKPDTTTAASSSTPPGARFAVQLGSFPDDTSARSWATKLKAAGVPAYTEHRKDADGTTHTLLRAGPFADRAAASAAIAKVREAGLTAGANGSAAE